MALTKLTADLEIISALDNEPNDIGGLTADELKAKFDEAGNLIKEFINETLAVETDAHIADTENPHEVTKAQVMLGNVDNTADADKPVSTAQQAELDLKANRLDVLEKTNATAYTPTADYNPATKKYVDSTAEDVVLGQIPDGSLTQTKLENTLSAKIDSAIQLEDMVDSRVAISPDVATALGLTGNPQVKDALDKLKALVSTAQTTADGRAKIVTGSYTGTGTSGSSNKNTLTFLEAPKLVLIGGATQNPSYTAFFIQGVLCASLGVGTDSRSKADWTNDGKTMSWYGDSVVIQFNSLGHTYIYTYLY